MLTRQVPGFRAADPNRREKMIREAADRFKSTWTEDIAFDRDAVIGVGELSVKLAYSQIFLAYFPISVRQS